MKLLAIASAFVLTLFGASASETTRQEDDSVMRLKLTHTQQILEGVTTADFDRVTEHAQALKDLAESERWKKIKTPEYVHFSTEFVRSVEGVLWAANERSVDRASNAYVRMTTHCFDCHKYVRDAE